MAEPKAKESREERQEWTRQEFEDRAKHDESNDEFLTTIAKEQNIAMREHSHAGREHSHVFDQQELALKMNYRQKLKQACEMQMKQQQKIGKMKKEQRLI